MKIKEFDVIELKNKNKAIILEVKGKDEYLVEIVNLEGNTVDKKVITKQDISKIVYPKVKER